MTTLACALLAVLCPPEPVSYSIGTPAFYIEEPLRYCVAAVDDKGVKIIIRDNLDEATFRINVAHLVHEGQHITEVTCDE